MSSFKIKGENLQKAIDALSPIPQVNNFGVTQYVWHPGEFAAYLLQDEIYTVKLIDNTTKRDEFGMQLFSMILIKNDKVFKKWYQWDSSNFKEWVSWKGTLNSSYFNKLKLILCC